ncbi:MAG: hypothetical protein KJO54_04555 [Gammaproteobacteria bacterium]|nr:hypothetical protein [Gammaproteobacteria bacterium]NNF60994.1 hypothetical protein [Gammaproteobacteria bacterium]NNM21092.1 hypothetical protein [Gammaproteobacteria bacterium]
MRFFFRKSRRNRKTVTNKDSSRQQTGELSISRENRGYDPYDTLPGVSRESFGMRRNDDGKWSF